MATIVPVHQRNIHVKLRDHQFVCRLHKLFSWLLSTRYKKELTTLGFSLIPVNLHSKNFVFQHMHLFCVGTNYLVLFPLLFLCPSAIFTSNYEIISSYVDSTGSFLGCYEVEKRMNNSCKFLDLDGYMLLSVLLKLL